MSRFGVGVEAVLQIDGLKQFIKGISTTSERKELLNVYAEEYLGYLHQRHNALSTGSGGWAQLSEITMKQRDRRKVVPPKRGRAAILADTLQLLATTGRKGGRGQVKLLDSVRMVATVGISDRIVYDDPRKKESKSRKKPARRTLAQLARFHQAQGRAIIVPPSEKVIRRLDVKTVVWIRKQQKKNG